MNMHKIIFGAPTSHYTPKRILVLTFYIDLESLENFVNVHNFFFGLVIVVSPKKKPGKNPIRFAHCFARFARYAAPAGRGVGFAGKMI